MKVVSSAFLAALVCASAGPALAAEATVAIANGVGARIGAATLVDGPTGVLVRLEVGGLKPGWHAVHFHAKGDCGDPAFQSAGAHINHAAQAKPHGLLNPAGPDPGDLPNIWAGADGRANAHLFSSLVSIDGQGGRPALKDADGSAVVIHENPDDYTTQPIGGAGPRVACGVVR